VILAVATSPSLDVTYVVEHVTEGAQLRPLSVTRVAGGKAINAARAAAALGAVVHVIAPLGGASGAFLAERLAADGILFTAIPTGPATRQCVSVSSAATGSLTEIYEHAASVADAWPALLDAARAGLSRAAPGAWVLVSGSIPDTGTAEPLSELAELAAQSGGRLAVDTHGPALLAALRLSPAVVKVNRTEAESALRVDAGGPAAELAAALQRLTGGLAVVTDGAAGSAAADGRARWSARLPGVRGDFPVGSGDSYLGGLLAALDQGAPVAEALRRGTAAGVANALLPGAAVFRSEDLARLHPQVEIRES
jgi:1-phosphofructokinase family hexose kinase